MCLKYFTLSFFNIILQIEISSEEQWEEALSGPGLLGRQLSKVVT